MTTLYNNFQIGDKVRFDNNNPKNVGKKLYGNQSIFTISKIINDRDGKILLRINEDRDVEYYSWRYIKVESLSSHQKIIDKIKYLDQRFKDRKCHS